MVFDDINDKSFRKYTYSTIEEATVAFEGSVTSLAFDAGGATIVGLLPDADFTGSEVSIQWSIDGKTFHPCKDATAADITIKVESEVFTPLTPTDLLAFRYIKFVSDETEDATLKVITRRVA